MIFKEKIHNFFSNIYQYKQLMLSFSVDSISYGVAYCSDCQTYFFPQDSTEIINCSIDCTKCGTILYVASKMVSDRSDQKFILEQCVREIVQLRQYLKEQIENQNDLISDLKSSCTSIIKDNVYLEKLSLISINGIDTLRSIQEQQEKREKDRESEIQKDTLNKVDDFFVMPNEAQ